MGKCRACNGIGMVYETEIGLVDKETVNKKNLTIKEEEECDLCYGTGIGD